MLYPYGDDENSSAVAYETKAFIWVSRCGFGSASLTIRFVTAVGLRARTFGGNFLTSIAVGGKILRASGQKTKATVPVSYLVN